MRKSLSGRKGYFIAYTDQNLQLHLMPPPQNVSQFTLSYYHQSIQRYYLAEGIYLSNIKPRPSMMGVV